MAALVDGSKTALAGTCNLAYIYCRTFAMSIGVLLAMVEFGDCIFSCASGAKDESSICSGVFFSAWSPCSVCCSSSFFSS